MWWPWCGFRYYHLSKNAIFGYVVFDSQLPLRMRSLFERLIVRLTKIFCVNSIMYRLYKFRPSTNLQLQKHIIQSLLFLIVDILFLIVAGLQWYNGITKPDLSEGNKHGYTLYSRGPKEQTRYSLQMRDCFDECQGMLRILQGLFTLCYFLNK